MTIRLYAKGFTAMDNFAFFDFHQWMELGRFQFNQSFIKNEQISSWQAKGN